jgi:hypothetical protein
MPLDPLINKINGRTKRLKKRSDFRKKELNIKYLGAFEEGYFVKYLKIPLNMSKGLNIMPLKTKIHRDFRIKK